MPQPSNALFPGGWDKQMQTIYSQKVQPVRTLGSPSGTLTQIPPPPSEDFSVALARGGGVVTKSTARTAGTCVECTSRRCIGGVSNIQAAPPPVTRANSWLSLDPRLITVPHRPWRTAGAARRLGLLLTQCGRSSKCCLWATTRTPFSNGPFPQCPTDGDAPSRACVV